MNSNSFSTKVLTNKQIEDFSFALGIESTTFVAEKLDKLLASLTVEQRLAISGTNQKKSKRVLADVTESED